MRFILIFLIALSASPALAKPNIIVILADDLGWRDVGFNGSEIKTPHLDRLAATGKRLTHFYAHPTCSPTALHCDRVICACAPWRDARPIQTQSKWLAAGLEIIAGIFETAWLSEATLAGKWHWGRASSFAECARI